MPSPRASAVPYVFQTMGTLGTARWSPGNAEIGEALRARSEQIERRLTRFDSGSEIAQLTPDWREVSRDAAVVLEAAEALRAETSGWFTPLLGAQVRQWEGVASGDLPIEAVRGGHGAVEVQGGAARLVGAEPGSVDLGAIAKGYAADELRDLAVELGATDVLVSLGGSSIAVAGLPATVALSSPWEGWERLGQLTLSGSLSISADPGTRIGRGRQRSHVLDPDHGNPAVTDLCGVVVCGSDGMRCEAFSTAYLAMGLDRALQMDVQHPEIKAVFMTVDGRILADPRLDLKADRGLQDWLRAHRPGVGE